MARRRSVKGKDALLIPQGESYSAIAFLMQNEREDRSLKECALSIDELETLLGVDLYYNFPDDIEESVESKVVWEDWNLR